MRQRVAKLSGEQRRVSLSLSLSVPLELVYRSVVWWKRNRLAQLARRSMRSPRLTRAQGKETRRAGKRWLGRSNMSRAELGERRAA